MKKFQILTPSNDGFMWPVATPEYTASRGVDPAYSVSVSDSHPLVFDTDAEAFEMASSLPKLQLSQFHTPNERGAVQGLPLAALNGKSPWYSTIKVSAYYVVPCIIPA